MMEESSSAIIHYTKDNRKYKGGWKDNNRDGDLPNPSDSRKPVDTFCECGSHGHTWDSCDYTAKLDQASRKTILNNYQKEQARRRKSKQIATAGRARQLRNNGDTKGLYDFMQEYQPYLDFPLPAKLLDHLTDNDE